MLREVLVDTDFDTDAGSVRVARGVTLATLLPLTNSTAGAGLTSYDPNRWSARRLVQPDDLAAKELVTTFGHGRHTCPAQGFSLQVIRAVVIGLITAFDVEITGDAPRPRTGQIGGVARAAAPSVVRLTMRN